MTANLRPEDGSRITLSGFMAVNRNRLKALSKEQLYSMVKTDELELLYIHLQSMQNFGVMLKKVSGTEKEVNKEEELVPA